MNRKQNPSADSMKLGKRSLLDTMPDTEPRRQAPAWIFSCTFHVAILFLLAWFWQPIRKGTGETSDRPVGIAIASSTTAGREYFLSESSSSDSAASSANASNNADATGSAAEAPLDMGELLSGLEAGGGEATGDLNSKVGSSGLGEMGAEIGSGGNVPKATTSVFGVTGTGTRFVYVFDRSDSMNGYNGKPLATAKRELINSLKSLQQVHQFQIVFYNDAPTFFRGVTSNTPKMLYGDDSSKLAAADFVRSMMATGGTEHANAIRMALAMGPDVIFFLTDAADPPMKNSQMQQIIDRATRNGTTIHCIEFGAGASNGAGGWIAELAEETSGEYRYVDVQQLDGTP
jgi:hypothetical protein